MAIRPSGRHSGWVWLLAVVGCATAGPSEVTPLRAELSALKQAREGDRERLVALEGQLEAARVELQVLRGEPVPAAATSATADVPPTGLTVVHLRPLAVKELPPVPTAVSVKEPSAQEMAELARPAPESATEASGSDAADLLFRTAFDKLKTGELVGAATLFEKFAQRFPRHPAADNALLDAGIAYYGLRRYQDAHDTFESLARRYPAGDSVAEALLRSGDCEEKLGLPAQATATYRRLVERHASAPEASKAADRLSMLERKPAPLTASEGGGAP